MNVLLIEDSYQFRALIREFFEAMGGIVTEAESPTSASRIPMERFRFDLIVSDVDSAELDGISFIERIESAIGSQRVMFMSGTDHERLIQQKCKAHPERVWEFLRKPFARKALQLKITSLLANKPQLKT